MLNLESYAFFSLIAAVIYLSGSIKTVTTALF
jgi:hypothetical protein